jgi:hypothetical protein
MKLKKSFPTIVFGLIFMVGTWGMTAIAQTQAATESGSVGLEGRINAPPPTTGASITFPRSGDTFTNIPVTVTGICPDGLLVKIFKNNIFSGSVICKNGSFSIVIDLFAGRNDLVARVYDELDQAGPDSNTVSVTFNVPGFILKNRISLLSSYAKRGSNPGETLTWPVTITGGDGPYAVSVDWGDGKKPDLLSREFAGTFDLTHAYDSPGVYNVIIRAADKNGDLAFLQLVAIANGPLSQTKPDQGAANNQIQPPQVKVLWQPAVAAIPLILATFWLGKRYQLHVLRKRLESGEDLS